MQNSATGQKWTPALDGWAASLMWNAEAEGGEELGPHFDRDTSTGTDNAEVPIERHK